VSIAHLAQELLRVYLDAQRLSNGSTVSLSDFAPGRHGKGGHGKHGATTADLHFGRDLPLCVELERNLARFTKVYADKVDAERRGRRESTAGGDRRSKAKKAENRAILAAVGLDSTALAYMYGRTTEGVRKLRRCHGLDPATGEPVTRDTLTAPAREALAVR
jgi:hypothetical protein